ncbi:glycosyltransferase [Frankia sp. AgB32]|uniref:nucleotide disphospho-sugar-binding domain-containing protein n=1 Tax=Frankia sp. AgB32 TaxID=631119 RepID=UPI00200CC907|nr:glycosyltransferase [Frankia sp. AgB32]MCK9893299.1 glycosyltransferase [Frankia sp. AgB32]
MSRVLFVVPPLTGHVNPAVGVAGELAARGHQVAVAGHASVIGPLVPPGLRLFALPENATEAERVAIVERSKGLRGPASLKFLWEEFLLPLGTASLPAIDGVVDEFRPDVLVADQQAIGAAVVARRRGLRWVTLATTSAELDDPYGVLAGLGQWVADLLRGFQVAHGVPAAAAAHGDLRFSDDLVIVFSVRELLGDASTASPSTVFVGSAVGGQRAASAPFPWEWFDADRRAVLVSLGTVTREAGGRFLRAAAEGLLSLRDQVQAVVVAPPGLVDDLDAPDDLLVAPFVPQVELMPRLSAVVCHGGNNTVCESLAHGLPLVVAPVRDDQPIIGEQVVRSGAGLRIKFGRTGPAGVAAAVSTVLDDPGYREAAGRLQDAFARAGGVAAAAEHVEKLIV